MKALAREQVIALDKAHVWHPYPRWMNTSLQPTRW